MILTMESLTPLYGEAVARVLVEAEFFDQGNRDDEVSPLCVAVRALRKADPPVTCEPPEALHLRAVADHLRGMEPGSTLPEHAVADRVLVLRRAYERHVEMVNDIKIALFETLPDGASVDDELAGVKLLGRLFREAKRAVETAKDCTDAVAVTLRYQLAQANTSAARERYGSAGVALDRASIHERLAEVECQADPVRKVIDDELNTVEALRVLGLGLGDGLYQAVRRACCRVAFYVAIGRVPDKKGA